MFVCKVLIFLNSEYIEKKMSLFPFQNADLLLLYLMHSLSLCYSLLNMFVTVAVINVKNCWQFEAICCISPCVNTVRSIIHTMDMSMSETETKRVDQTTTDVCA